MNALDSRWKQTDLYSFEGKMLELYSCHPKDEFILNGFIPSQ